MRGFRRFLLNNQIEIMNKRKTGVLHITPHLGGGVGRVLLNYFTHVKDNPDFTHQVASLDYANEKACSVAKEIGLALSDRMSGKKDKLLAMIADAEIVLVHWWNHPLLYDFFVRETLPPARIVFWAHNSGFHPPCVFNETALGYPDLFVFTTPLSFETREVSGLPRGRHKDLRAIVSTGGIAHAASVRPKPHRGFNVGYIGTVNYCKLHPDFLDMSGLVNLPDVRFTVCGGPSERRIRDEAIRRGLGEKFLFTGLVEDITGYLSEFDVFGYPLAPYHYGTGEQALCEAMAAGVPPVVLANKTECYLVQNGVTGLIAADKYEYAKAIEELYRNSGLRGRLSANAREVARSRFSLERMADEWAKVFFEALALEKTPRKWAGSYAGKGVLPYQFFLESLGKYAEPFLRSIDARSASQEVAANDEIKKLYESSRLWIAETQGTPCHYSHFFPEDGYLRLWSELSVLQRQEE